MSVSNQKSLGHVGCVSFDFHSVGLWILFEFNYVGLNYVQYQITYVSVVELGFAILSSLKDTRVCE